jgi:hypothetical protein
LEAYKIKGFLIENDFLSVSDKYFFIYESLSVVSLLSPFWIAYYFEKEICQLKFNKISLFMVLWKLYDNNNYWISHICLSVTHFQMKKKNVYWVSFQQLQHRLRKTSTPTKSAKIGMGVRTI